MNHNGFGDYLAFPQAGSHLYFMVKCLYGMTLDLCSLLTCHFVP